jgi:Sigma-70, region 4
VKYREPILLCYLQGQTNEEAATLLHCPTGTIKIRLLRAREILRKRLVKRGLTLAVAAAVGEALTEMARAAVPQPLTHAATHAATVAATGPVLGLAQGVLKSICLAKIKVAAILLLTVGLVCVADGLLTRAAAAPVVKVHSPFDHRQYRPSSPPDALVAATAQLPGHE